MRRLAACTALPLASLAATCPSLAAETPRPISVAILGGYGVNDSNSYGGDTLNVYGVGLGARAGYTFGFGGYVGATYLHHFGFSKDLGGGVSASGRVAPLGIEAGYDLRLGSITLRPYLGAGVALYSSSVTGGAYPQQGNGQKPALWPGVVATYDLGDRVFAGADLRYTAVSVGSDTSIVGAGQGSASAFGAYATLGARI